MDPKKTLTKTTKSFPLEPRAKTIQGKPENMTYALPSLRKTQVLQLLFCFLSAVLVLQTAHSAEPFEFKPRGLTFAIIAGVLGAGGALGIIFALKTGGKPIYVAPLVFGIAPIVNVIITMLWHRPKTAPSPMFFVGLALSAVGVGLILRFKPT